MSAACTWKHRLKPLHLNNLTANQMYKIFILLLLVSIQLNGQQYKPLLDSVNVWCFTGNVPPADIPDTFYTGSCDYQNLDQFAHSIYSSHDTIIDSINYKVLESVNIQSNFCRYGYIREDTSARKVYFRDNILNPEVLLYDFSMQVGDVIYLDFPTSGGIPYYPSDFYTVDSIVNTVLAGGSTNAYYLSCGTCWHMLEWVEGVGNRGSLAYTFTQNNTNKTFQNSTHEPAFCSLAFLYK